jgi:hypothetical protein
MVNLGARYLLAKTLDGLAALVEVPVGTGRLGFWGCYSHRTGLTEGLPGRSVDCRRRADRGWSGRSAKLCCADPIVQTVA